MAVTIRLRPTGWVPGDPVLRSITGTAAGSSSDAATARRRVGLTGTASGTSSGSATARLRTRLSGTASGGSVDSGVLSGVTELYPNRPDLTGWSVIAEADGTVAESGGVALGVSWLGPWDIDASTTLASKITSIADATNPLGSGSSLRFVWDQATNPRCAQAIGTFPAGYSEIYMMQRILYEEAAWNNWGHKFWYIGLPNVVGDVDFYFTRANGGAMSVYSQAEGRVLIESWDAADGGQGVSSPLATEGVWYNIECYFARETGAGNNGIARIWVDGILVGECLTANWGGAFGSLEWYADNNAITTSPVHYRIGELYIAGKV